MLCFGAGGVAPVAGDPLANNVVARPPHAFGSLVGAQEGVSDRSGNHFTVFSIPSEDVLFIHHALEKSRQFRRYGPVMADVAGGIPAQPAYVQAYTLKSLNGLPHHIQNFGRTS
jgi:hypothetical protein